jgi:hypothetical protein
MMTKNSIILQHVAIAHSIFYVLKRQDQMCYQTNTWNRALSRMFLDMPPYLRSLPKGQGLAMLVKSRIARVYRISGWGIAITLAEEGRKLARA